VDSDKSILNEVDSLVFDSKGHKEDINQEQRNYEYNLKTDSSRFQPNIQMMRAWYYAATGNGTSTQATLNALMFKFPAIAYHPLFKFITGVAQFQQSEYDISLDYLNMISPTAEVLFWVSQSRGMQERVHMSDAALAYSQELIKNYPEPLGLKIFQTSLQIASQVEDATIMISLLDPKLKMKDETHRAFKQFYTGKLLKLQNKPQEAPDVWVALLRSASDERRLDPRLKVEARFEIIKYEHDMGKIKSEDALEKLEVLRLSWRGDSFEYTITREIVAVQLKLKRYLDALKTLRRIRKLYPSFILLDLIESEMEEVVMSYFRENKNPTNPLQSISIYQEFQDFIPENDEGRAVIIHIADLFEKLDLLEQSAGVLTLSLIHI
jgi:tetratricopeptide (TPR) repeat protein